MARDEEAGDRTADQTRDDQPERRGRDADFERIRDAEPLGDDRRPGDRRAVPADERGGADERGDPLGQTERGDAAGGDQVLDHEIDQGQGEQDKERTAAGNEVAEPGVEADAGEEVEQQHVARVEREADLDAEHDIDEQCRRGRQRPPVTGSGMFQRRSGSIRRLRPAPAKNTRMAIVKVSRPGT